MPERDAAVPERDAVEREGLVVRGLVVGYGRRSPVLNGVRLDLKPGRFISLLGPNGAGKSTLLHAILGLVPHRSGSVLLDGAPLAEHQRLRTGFCADDLPLPDLLTGVEFMNFSSVARGVRLSRREIGDLFEALNMAGAEHRVIREYSHGMKRTLMLVASILHRPRLLMLDEPFRGLDPEAHLVMVGMLRRAVAANGIVVISTHDLSEAARLSDDVLVLERGVVRHLDESLGAITPRAPREQLLRAALSPPEQQGARLDRLTAILNALDRAG